MKQQKHVHRSPSSSSVNSDSPATDVASDEYDDSCKKNKQTRSNSLRLPKGVTPDQAAKILPSSVKTALGNHAQSESMGYFVLLPHEVVQLNDVNLEI